MVINYGNPLQFFGKTIRFTDFDELADLPMMFSDDIGYNYADFIKVLNAYLES